MDKNWQFTIEDDDFVCGVNVKSASVQGECGRIVIQRRVGGRIVLYKKRKHNGSILEQEEAMRVHRSVQLRLGF